jgi:hypothetical protein
MNAQDVRLAGDIMIMARSFGAVGSATMAVALLRARRLRALGWIGVVLGVLTLLLGIQEGLVDRGIGVSILGSDLGVVSTAIICITALIGRANPAAGTPSAPQKA